MTHRLTRYLQGLRLWEPPIVMIWSLVLWACGEHPLVDLHVVHHPVTCDVLTSMEVRQPLSRWNHMRLGIVLELSLTRVGGVHLQLRPSQEKHVDA